MDLFTRRLVCVLVFSGLIANSSSRPVIGADWPAFDNDAGRSGVSAETLKFPLGQAWILPAAQRPRPAWTEPGRTANMFAFDIAPQPVAVGGLLYYGSSADDTLYARDINTGAIVWTFTTDAPLRFAPQIVDNRCYFAGDDGRVYCRDAKTGAEVWTFSAAPEPRQIVGNGRLISRWPCRTGIVVHDGVVYATAGMWPAEGTYFYALDAKTGKPKWTNDTLNAMYLSYPHDGVAFGGPTPQGYLLTDGQHLVVPTGQSAPAVLEAKTGKLVQWQQQRPGSTWARLGPGFVMMSGRGWQPDQELRLGEAPLFRGDGVGFYDFATGDITPQKKWLNYDALPESPRYQLERWRGQIGPIGGRDRTVLAGTRLIATGMNSLEALDASGDKLRRVWRIDQPRTYNVIVAGEYVLTGCDGKVNAHRVADGTLAWSAAVDGQAHGLAVANGTLFVTTDKGTVHAFAAGKPATATASFALAPDEPPRTGFAIVVGSTDVTAAAKFAATSRLNVVCLLRDPAAVTAARKQLLNQGYGQKIVVQTLPSDGKLPFADYFANVVIVDGNPAGIRPDELYRVLHPYTGVLRWPKATPAEFENFVKYAQIDSAEVDRKYQVIQRAGLRGAFDWNSQNEVDERVKWPLELMWFGGPGRERTMSRHKQGLPPPLAAHGRNVLLGDGHVTTIDAYNGCELWSRVAPGYHYVSADDKAVYIGLPGRTLQCNAQTGALEKIYGAAQPVVFSLSQPRTFTTKTTAKYGGDLKITKDAQGVEFTFETTTSTPDDKDCWTLWCDFRNSAARLTPDGRGAFPLIINTTNSTLRKFDGFVGAVVPPVSLTKSGGKIVLRIEFVDIQKLTGTSPVDFDLAAELTLYSAFDLKLRERPLTGGKDPWGNGTATFALSGTSNSPLASVARANIADLPKHAQDWGRTPLHVRHDGNIPRPPLAATASPELQTRVNPITGESESRTYLRGYGCSGTISSATMDFFRSGTFGMYDLADDSGMRNFAGVRPGCRITIAPALGVLFSAEGVGDCFCPYNFSTSMALAPAHGRRQEDWAVFVDKPRVAQVQKLALNLAAPGDRRDDEGTLWLGYPRQPMMFATGGAIGPRPHAFGLPAVFEVSESGGPIRVNADRISIAGTANPWVYASAIAGIKRLSLGLTFHEPRTTALATAITQAPKIDASMNDPAWSGDPGVAVITDGKKGSEKGRVRLRHDAQNLYVAYEQQPNIDRKGVTLPWTDAYFDVLFKDTSKSAYAQFNITARGAKSARAIHGVVPVPEVKQAAIDGTAADWGQQGQEFVLPEGRGTLRCGWTNDGLALLAKLTAKATDKPGPGVRVQIANMENPAVVEAVIDAARHTAEIIEADIGNDEETNNKPVKPGSKAKPIADVVDDGDVAKKELEKFRASKKVTASVVAKASGDETLVECVIPFTRLNLKSAPGTVVGLQISFYDPAAGDRNISGGAGARRTLFSSGGIVSLSLADTPAGAPIAAASAKREWFGATALFPPVECPIGADAWQAAAKTDDHAFHAEFAIPWSVLQAAGLTRDRLLAQFHTPGKAPPNLDLLYQAFIGKALRVYTDPPPLKPAEYIVRLHFAEIEDLPPGARVFDIKLQGRIVASGFDIVREAGGPRRALTKSFTIKPETDLELEFVPKTGLPLLNGFELLAVPPK